MTPHRSPNQHNRYMTCPRQYAYIYEEGLRIKPSGILKQGNVFHQSTEFNNRQKAITHEDLKETDVTDHYTTTWKAELEKEEVVFDPGQKPDQVRDQGIALLKVEHKVLAPKIQPRSESDIERRFVHPFNVALREGEEPVVFDFVGIMDVITEIEVKDPDTGKLEKQGVIHDYKTLSTNRIPTPISLAQDYQLSSYSLLYRLIEGKAEAGLVIDGAIKTARPTAASFPTTRNREQLRDHLTQMAAIESGIQHHVYPKRTGGWWCSKKFCGFWDICEGKNLTTIDMGVNNGK